MRKITLLFALFAFILNAMGQVVLIQENFQNWTAQGTSGEYTITKTLADGVTNGTFTSDKLVVAPAQSIGGQGTAPGNGSPTPGRVVVGSTAGYLELPTLPSIGQVDIKANIGTDLRTMKLQIKNGSVFEDIPNTVTEINNAVTKLYTFNFAYSSPTTIRIVTSNSSLNIWDLVVSSYSSNLPKLASPVVSAATDVLAEGFTAHWASVSNATGYTIKVYKGINLEGTFNATGQATTSFEIKGISTNSTFTYTVVAKGNGIDFSDSDESAASAEFTTLEGLTAISTNFSDGTWGTLYTQTAEPGPIAPTVSGTYPSSYHNGFDILNSFLYDIVRYDSRGERKENGIRMDRQTFGGMFVLPAVKSIEQLEIHAIPGGAPRSITLKELLANGTWSTIGTYEMTSSADYKEFIIPISRTTPTKLRIENAGSGQVTIYQVITRTTNPTLLTPPTIGSASGINASGFTANWSTVENATGYKVRVYQGTTLVGTYEAAGQATESLAIGGLNAETEFTYKVYAIGDGFVSHADSYLSAASAPVTTSIGTSLEELNNSNFAIVTGKKISLSETGNINIFNLQGSLVYQAKNVNAVNTNLASGMYIVNFTNASGKKLIQKISIK
jgi:hypothetical protein